MYLAMWTRPDIAYPVSILSQFNTNNTWEHWHAAKRILRYLKGTNEHCVVYKSSAKGIEGFVDASYAGKTDERKSYSGYMFKLGSAAISWGSKKQRCTSLLYCIYYAFVKSIQGLIPIGCRTCLRIIQKYLG